MDTFKQRFLILTYKDESAITAILCHKTKKFRKKKRRKIKSNLIWQTMTLYYQDTYLLKCQLFEQPTGFMISAILKK